LKQNRYYFGVVLKVISDDTGHTTDDLHAFFKTMFLKDKVEIKGKTYAVVRGTSDLSTSEFVDYVKEVKMWVAQNLDIFVPDAKDVETDSEYF